MASDEQDGLEGSPDYENLDLSFDGLLEPSSDPTNFEKPGRKAPPDISKNDSASPIEDDLTEDYILGTLVVRIVAARDLEGVVNKGNIGNAIFGSRGSANPYVSVRFGKSMQRTSQMFDTVDPIWPRGETMYMDVSHPSFSESKITEQRQPNPSSASLKAPPQKSLKKPPPNSAATAFPGDPPVKASFRQTLERVTAESTLESDDATDPNQPRDPVLTIAVFHGASSDTSAPKYNPRKDGDSNDTFLGMSSFDLTGLLTGKTSSVDEWLPLSGGRQSESNRPSCVRIVCEYEPSDAAPQKSDLVRFTGYCRPADIYPAHVDRLYQVDEVLDGGDNIVISWTSPEKWVSSYCVHRHTLVCEARHQGAMEMCQDEFETISNRIGHSPMVNVVQDAVTKIPDEGLVAVGAEAVKGGVDLLGRWFDNGLGTMIEDIKFATNIDGRHNPSLNESLATDSVGEQQPSDPNTSDSEAVLALTPQQDTVDKQLEFDPPENIELEPIPNMPACPITGEPMSDPVVAADGHTYERSAIARWLRTSDKSPLTGMGLAHKNLVPNYMLMSSLQEAAVLSVDDDVQVDGVSLEDVDTTDSASPDLPTVETVQEDDSSFQDVE